MSELEIHATSYLMMQLDSSYTNMMILLPVSLVVESNCVVEWWMDGMDGWIAPLQQITRQMSHCEFDLWRSHKVNLVLA